MSSRQTSATLPIVTTELRMEHDVVLARQNARFVAELLGFDMQDQTRIATAVSEVARNAYQYAGGGRVEFLAGTDHPQSMLVRVRDSGPGIHDLQAILEGRYESASGMGQGLVGSRRLMDSMDIETEPGRGTTVLLSKRLPARAPDLTPQLLARLAEKLVRNTPSSPLGEMQRQNQELLRAMEELRQKQDDLARLNQELEDTNRGVVALYAELDERATYLRRVSELKSRYLSNMSHEFRTPLNSILSLTGLLLDRIDGDLTVEQERQVTFIRRSATDLSELVNDLLDLAKAEAGKIAVRPSQFEAVNLFGALRGVLKPLIQTSSVSLHFDDPVGVPTLQTDESKVSQILRNFVSNALKFTRAGEVRVSATAGPDGVVTFAVSDTGIGIAPEDQELIFEEFSQVENPLQQAVKGTGLGLPLSRKLAELLGGRVWVESEAGRGSTFFAAIPMVYQGVGETPSANREGKTVDSPTAPVPVAQPIRVLLIDDDEIARYVLRSQLANGAWNVTEAAGGEEGLRLAREIRPQVIFLDLAMPDLDGFQVLNLLKSDSATNQIPVIIHTSMPLSPERQQELSARAARVLRKGSANNVPVIALREVLAAHASGVDS